MDTETLKDTALKRLRQMVQGNGMRPEDVTVESFDIKEHRFLAHLVLRLSPEISERKIAGRTQQGALVESPSELKHRVDEGRTKITQDNNFRSQVFEQLASRPDHGWAIDAKSLSLGQLKQEYCAHEECGTCHGKGKGSCGGCGGQGRANCTKCGGQGQSHCIQCRGSGMVQTSDGSQTGCTYCHASGVTSCEFCHGQRVVPCPNCQGQGSAACQPCNGTGWHTIIATVEYHIQPDFSYVQKTITPALRQHIETIGIQRLAKGGHLDIRALEDGEDIKPSRLKTDGKTKTIAEIDNEDFLNSARRTAQDGEIVINYLATIPYGQAVFRFRKAAIKTPILGTKGKMLDVPPFMDKLLKKPVMELQDAAKGQGFVAGKIAEASRYRAIAGALYDSAGHNEKYVRRALLHHYPIGLTPKAAHMIAHSIHLAMKRITRMPRYIGLSAGLLLSYIFYLAYFERDLRDKIATELAGQHSHMLMGALDILTIPVLFILVILCIRMAGLQALKMAMRKVGLGMNKTTPKAGTSGLWGFLGVTTLFGYFTWITQPDWLRAILTLFH